jgi:hypothetical protein
VLDSTKSGREMGDSETSDIVHLYPPGRRNRTRSSEDDSVVTVAIKNEKQIRIFYPRNS